MDCAIEIAGITKSYGGHAAVDDVAIQVKSGETFGLLGANGAGKTTLMECVLGVKNPDSGTATILGLNPKIDRKQLFEHVGVQFQEIGYQDKIKVKEICRITASFYQKPRDYRDLLRQFKLEGKEQNLVSSLSGGERQRLFVILALIPEPRVVFLDELTTGLDVKSRRDVWRYLTSLKEEGITLFMTSHFMDEVELLCDRIAILRRGRIVFEGTVSETIASGPFESFEEAYLFYAEEEYDESL